MAPDIMTICDRPNASNWHLERGYKNGINSVVYPFREHNAGPSTGFTFTLHTLRNDVELLCTDMPLGYLLFMHTPGDILTPLDTPVRLAKNEQVSISIKPKLITTSEGLRRYKPDVRQCFYDSERQLRFFRTYSQTNCEHECLANYTLNKCGCVLSSMPSNLKLSRYTNPITNI